MLRALILAAFVIALGYPVYQNANAQARATANPAKGAQDSQPSMADAVENGLERVSRSIEAAHANPYAEASEQRADRDLEAQQDMAKWAMWVFAATAFTALLTAIGVLLIWRTLIHTRRASKYAGVGARQARRAAIASDRMAVEAAKATLAAVEASKAGQEANRLTRSTQSEARTTARWEARKAERRQAAADKRAEAAYAIAERSAEATAAQVTVVQDTAKRQLRAYLCIRAFTIELRDWEDPEYAFTILLLNNGVTPATVTRIVLNAYWVHEGGEDTAVVEADIKIHIRCHKDTPVSMPYGFKEDFRGADKPGFMLAIGRVEYRDEFGVVQKETFGFSTGRHGTFDDFDFPVSLSAYPIETMIELSKEKKKKAGAKGEPEKPD